MSFSCNFALQIVTQFKEMAYIIRGVCELFTAKFVSKPVTGLLAFVDRDAKMLGKQLFEAMIFR